MQRYRGGFDRRLRTPHSENSHEPPLMSMTQYLFLFFLAFPLSDGSKSPCLLRGAQSLEILDMSYPPYDLPPNENERSLPSSPRYTLLGIKPLPSFSRL